MIKKTLEEFEKEVEINNRELDLIMKLIALRNEKGLTQKELANLLGMKQPAIARLEKAKISPSLTTVIKILDKYGYTLDIKKIK